ncbi:response regulator [Paenibacillus sp. MWE-103]|uniref:Response regulator n=1 Tax=Paenibacillus artemisiicola TaxID=1172618 RepID=A0ABS3WC97_9BACL|nr:response regulator [Paenibacillus artemisiicola]MBO7745735.1 response regulator [Paenibacillus artemisiicola]
MLRLFIVDDEWLIRKGIVRMVERLSTEWKIEEASNGLDAVERIKQAAFDLIFCDIKMPGRDGIETLDELTRQGYRIPVVFLTGYDEFALMQSALRLRAYDYLLKPVHDNDILAVFTNFKKDFLSITMRSDSQHAKLQQFEFHLLNALESFDAERVAGAIEEGQASFGGCMTMTAYVDEIRRIANHFFSKHRIHGFDKDVLLTSNDVSNLSAIQHAIRIRFTLIKGVEEKETNNLKIIRLVKDYIKTHLQHPLTLAEVADYVHFNPTYFSEYFKEKSGETFIHYVTRMKIEQAKTMLADPTVKITYVSEYLGYKDPRSFSKMFKIFLGMTPTEYRNLQT